MGLYLFFTYRLFIYIFSQLEVILTVTGRYYLSLQTFAGPILSRSNKSRKLYIQNFFFQVSTETGGKSHYFNLHVMVPTAFILGSDEYHTQAGNSISLVCIIENVNYLIYCWIEKSTFILGSSLFLQSLEPPQYVFWHHNGVIINYDRVSRVSVQTDPGNGSFFKVPLFTDWEWPSKEKIKVCIKVKSVHLSFYK